MTALRLPLVRENSGHTAEGRPAEPGEEGCLHDVLSELEERCLVMPLYFPYQCTKKQGNIMRKGRPVAGNVRCYN
jgi:hypothetical protein